MSANVLTWGLNLDASGFHKSLNKATSAVESTVGKGFGDLIAPIAKVTAAVGSVAAIMKGITGSLDLGAEMQDASNRTGIAVENVMMLRKAFKDSGVDAEALPGAINKMQRSLAGMGKGGGAATNVLHGLGLDPQTLASAKPDEAFRKIGAAINALPNATERSAAAMALFGRSGGELLQVFASPAFQNAGNISNTAKLLGENAASFKEAHEALSHVGGKLQGFFVGISSGFVPMLGEVIDDFEKMDFSKAGKGLGAMIGNFDTDWRKELKTITDLSLELMKIVFSPATLKPFGLELLAIAASFGTEIRRVMLDAKQGTLTEKLVTGFQSMLMTGVELYNMPFSELMALQKKTDEYNKAHPEQDRPLRPFEYQQRVNKGLIRDGFLGDLDQQNKDSQSYLSGMIGNAKQDFAKKIEEALKKYPAFTATPSTDAANAEGREKARKKYQIDLNGGKYDPTDLGAGKASIIADSFAKIGGGGTSSFLGVLDVNRQQLQAQNTTNRLLEKFLAGGGGFSAAQLAK